MADILSLTETMSVADGDMMYVVTNVATTPTDNKVSISTLAAKFAGTGITTINRQIFTTSGNYTPTAGMVKCIVRAIAGGGGGGASGTLSSGYTGAGGGGGAGAYAEGVFTHAQIVEGGSAATVTVGAAGDPGSMSAIGVGGTGGDTMLQANSGSGTILIQVSGGTGGAAGAEIATQSMSSGGTGGAAVTGQLLVNGGDGQVSIILDGANSIGVAGAGAGSPFGQSFVKYVSATPPVVGQYGAGGVGGILTATVGSQNGGPGGAGIVIIDEFIA